MTEPLGGKMSATPIAGSISTRLQRIAELAREDPRRSFLSLSHHIDVDLLHEAFLRTRKDGAVGVDGQTAREYERDLLSNLTSLEARFKSGRYEAPPVRRVHIPKGDGKSTRPIGIPSFEDKVLQRAVAMVLGAVYEQDFVDCSYGFRPRRSARQALDRLRQGIKEMGGGWVLELDIRSYFDTIDRRRLGEILDQRVRDGVLRRTIGKWLAAGVLEQDQLHVPEAGTPQGGVISPLLANIYLHEVLDTWFEGRVRPRLRGRAFLVRYADDAVLVFLREDDARRTLAALPKRFSEYGLTLHPDKTRLIRFVPCVGGGSGRDDEPRGFTFLGFRHLWARTRRGGWGVFRKTARGRVERLITRLWEWCRRHRHLPIRVQQERLGQALRGHYAYFHAPGNWRALHRARYRAERLWRYWLNRRSQKRDMPWKRFKILLRRFPLPAPPTLAANPSS